MKEPASFIEGSINGCPDNEIVYPLFKPGAFITLFLFFNLSRMNAEKYLADKHYYIYRLTPLFVNERQILYVE